MKAKIFILAIIAISCCTDAASTLRRTPKVYNALITTDENLTSSRSYPVIQPTIHETGIAHFPPFGPYNPYNGFYSPPLVRFAQPIAPGFLPREQIPSFHLFQPQLHQRRQSDLPNFPDYFLPKNFPPHQIGAEPEPPSERQQPPAQAENEIEPETENKSKLDSRNTSKEQENNESEIRQVEKIPIPLNEYGLPPSLIPLQTSTGNRNENAVNLPPYLYHHYPIVYDPITGFREQYLPPYDYFPSQNFRFTPSMQSKPTRRDPAEKQSFLASTAATPAATTALNDDNNNNHQSPTTTPNFENKNSEIPDVPPPPIPFGGKQAMA